MNVDFSVLPCPKISNIASAEGFLVALRKYFYLWLKEEEEEEEEKEIGEGKTGEFYEADCVGPD